MQRHEKTRNRLVCVMIRQDGEVCFINGGNLKSVINYRYKVVLAKHYALSKTGSAGGIYYHFEVVRLAVSLEIFVISVVKKLIAMLLQLFKRKEARICSKIFGYLVRYFFVIAYTDEVVNIGKLRRGVLLNKIVKLA